MSFLRALSSFMSDHFGPEPMDMSEDSQIQQDDALETWLVHDAFLTKEDAAEACVLLKSFGFTSVKYLKDFEEDLESKLKNHVKIRPLHAELISKAVRAAKGANVEPDLKEEGKTNDKKRGRPLHSAVDDVDNRKSSRGYFTTTGKGPQHLLRGAFSPTNQDDPVAVADPLTHQTEAVLMPEPKFNKDEQILLKRGSEASPERGWLVDSWSNEKNSLLYNLYRERQVPAENLKHSDGKKKVGVREDVPKQTPVVYVAKDGQEFRGIVLSVDKAVSSPDDEFRFTIRLEKKNIEEARLCKIEIKEEFGRSTDIDYLVTELDSYLLSLYPKEQSHGVPIDSLFNDKRVRFFVARLQKDAVGCGGFRQVGDEFELKRMFVLPKYRKLGIANAILNRISEEAKKCGATVLHLETGNKQSEAIGLYKSFGFQTCDVFGDYKDMSPHRIKCSVFMSMKLS